MEKTANVIGATGMVGRQLVKQLLAHRDFSVVRMFVRRKTGLSHPKLDENIIDLRKPETWEHLVLGDVLFSTLGTTLKQAGSKEKEFEVDFTFNLHFAKAAMKNGIPSYILVSSAGANPKSPVFYTRMKGQLDEAILATGFSNAVILRPSILDGSRMEKRTIEETGLKISRFLTKFILKKYRPIKGETVARAMINAALADGENHSGKIYTLDEIFELAGE